MSGNLSVTPDAGVIAVLVRGDESVSVHRRGSPTEALQAVVELCDAGGWKISVLSSPVTIYRDLDGSRVHGAHDYAHAQLGFPENKMLARLNRMDLWERP